MTQSPFAFSYTLLCHTQTHTHAHISAMRTVFPTHLLMLRTFFCFLLFSSLSRSTHNTETLIQTNMCKLLFLAFCTPVPKWVLQFLQRYIPQLCVHSAFLFLTGWEQLHPHLQTLELAYFLESIIANNKQSTALQLKVAGGVAEELWE